MCKKGIASIGETKQEILQDCGNPTYIRHTTREYKRYGSTQRTNMEEWVYDNGPNELIHLVCFRDNEVIQIYSTDTYGTKR
jgi:hypothetical protein